MTRKIRLKSEKYKGLTIDFYQFNSGFGREVKSYVNRVLIIPYSNSKAEALQRTKEAIDDGAHKRSWKGY